MDRQEVKGFLLQLFPKKAQFSLRNPYWHVGQNTVTEVFPFYRKATTFRKKLEYSFKDSRNGELTTLQLSDYSLMLRKHGKEQVIAYASIISVRISKSSGKNFKMFLSQDGHPPVVIPNYSFSEKGDSLDQSGAYSLFVRVLHHYLKDKSRLVFTSGGDVSRIWQWPVISATFSLIISVAADYVGFSLINPYVQAVILTGLTIVMVVALTPGKLPKTYMPTDIPLQFLP